MMWPKLPFEPTKVTVSSWWCPRLTNAPSTFQSLMNSVFKPHLRKFVLVFFDDILVYSKTWKEHLTHLRTALELLRIHKLFVKKTKCAFGQQSLKYLGHIILSEGVSADSVKVGAMQSWSTPTTLKSLRGFLGLTGYYRRFVLGYGKICTPLTALLKKDAFGWNEEAERAFNTLKAVMTTPLCLFNEITTKNLSWNVMHRG